MIGQLTHDELREMLALDALGALDGAEADAVRAHLEGCAECRAEWEELRAAADWLAYSAPAAEMEPSRAAGVRANLVDRARGERASAGGGASSANVTDSGDADRGKVIAFPSRPARRMHPAWLATAASVLLLLGLGAYTARLQGRYNALNDAYGAVYGARDRLVAAVAGRDSAIHALTDPGTKVIELASTGAQAPSGRMFWDPRAQQWVFFAHDMPRLRQGRDYQLWIITPSGPVSHWVFKPNAAGHAEVRMKYPLGADSLRAVAVTEEPEGGLAKPSSAPLIIGTRSE